METTLESIRAGHLQPAEMFWEVVVFMGKKIQACDVCRKIIQYISLEMMQHVGPLPLPLPLPRLLLVASLQQHRGISLTPLLCNAQLTEKDADIYN